MKPFPLPFSPALVAIPLPPIAVAAFLCTVGVNPVRAQVPPDFSTPCVRGWDDTIGMPGLPGLSVNALTIYDDGTGSALIAGGDFLVAGDEPALNIAKWNWSTETWSPLGLGLPGPVYSLAVYDEDGPGGARAALFAGGSFDEGDYSIARWDGSAWTIPGNGLPGDPSGDFAIVRSLHATTTAQHVPGDGAVLYAAGYFGLSDGVLREYKNHRVAVWDGSSWSTIGQVTGSLCTEATVVETWDDGDGLDLYVGGSFSTVDYLDIGISIARWDGAGWSALVDDHTGILGLECPAPPAPAAPAQICIPRALAIEGSAMNRTVGGDGNSLYVSGEGACDGPNAFHGISRWDGQRWHPLGATTHAGNGLSGIAWALTIFNDGTGWALHAGGNFEATYDFGVVLNNVGKWNGQQWLPLPYGMPGEFVDDPPVKAFASDNFRRDPSLYLGGAFSLVLGGGEPSSVQWLLVDNIVRWLGPCE